MQQERGETEAGREDQQEQQQSAPLRCPCCNSTDTKFRYYNNNDQGQPQHYCKTCRRYWTVGGSLRNIPFGGARRSNGKPTKDSSSLYSRISSASPNISSSDEWEHKLQHPTPLVAAVSAPNSHASSYAHDLNDEISCLAAIQSLTQPHAANESFNTRNHFGCSSADITISQGRNFHSMRLHQPLPQQLPSYRGDNPAGHPNNWRMNPLPQDFNNTFGFSAANASNWNNSSGNTNDPETARTSMNSNDFHICQTTVARHKILSVQQFRALVGLSICR